MENINLHNRVKPETIQKYFDALIDLKKVLSYTDRISLNEFCIKNKLSKNFPIVLQKGGIIKCITKGKYSKWEWISINPNNHMAVKTIQMLGQENPPRKKVIKNTIENKSKIEQINIIEKPIVLTNKNIVVRLFFGLFSFTINI